MIDVVTTDLAKFNGSQKAKAAKLLTEMTEQGLPNGFYDDEVTVMLNTNSGMVFLTNSEFQVAMMNGHKLEMWHNCPECGHEGFLEDMHHDGDHNCARFLMEIGLAPEEEAVEEEVA